METQSKLQQEMEASVKRSFQQGKNVPAVGDVHLPAKGKKFKDMTNFEKTKLAMDVVRNQPGRIPRDTMIKQLMNQKGMTRSQAKEEIKRFDTYMVSQFLERMEKTELEKSISPERVKPLIGAMFRGMGFQA